MAILESNSVIITLLIFIPIFRMGYSEDDNFWYSPEGLIKLHKTLNSSINTRFFSAKEFIPKDFSPESNKRATIGLEQRVSSMEDSVTGIYEGVQKLKSKTVELESTLTERRTLIGKLEEGFADMERVLVTQKDVMEELMDKIGPNDKSFAVSNHTCGEALFARSGYIIYSDEDRPGNETGSWYEPLHCVWTIQAGHFSEIKIIPHDLRLPSHLKAYTVELVSSDDNGGDDDVPSLQTTRTRQLVPHVPQLLKGPVIFLVLTRNNSDLVRTDTSTTPTDVRRLVLEYEGWGKLMQKRTQFYHTKFHSYNGSGGFSDSDLETWKEKGLEDYYNNNGNYGYNFTREFGTVVLSNFRTKVVFKLKLSRVWCPTDGFFIAIPDLLANGTSLVNLCQSNVSNWNNGVTVSGTPVAFLMGMSPFPRVPFGVEWNAETSYPNNYYGPKRGHRCGGVLGGTGGTISFRTELSNETVRCVWVIVPQPEMRSIIAIRNLRYHGSGYRRPPQTTLALLELTDVDGTGLDIPKSLDLIPFAGLSGWTEYSITGREVYIDFQAEPMLPTLVSQAKYFSFDWALSGNVSKNGGDASPDYTLFNGDTDSLTASGMRAGGQQAFPRPYQVFILSRSAKFSYLEYISISEMKLELSQISPNMSNHDQNDNSTLQSCFSSNVAVYASIWGFVEKTAIGCTDPGNFIIENTDGIAVIVMKMENQTAPNITLKYKLTEASEPPGAASNLNGQCGGLLTGNSGVLSYKEGRIYEGNERCIWLIHAPNCSSISVTLVMGGLYGLRYLVANTIDADTGSMRNETFVLNTLTPTHIIEEEFLILLFQTATGKALGTGFTLHYTGLDCMVDGTGAPARRTPIHYHLEYSPFTNLAFSQNMRGSPNGDLYVYAYSEAVTSYTDVNSASTVVDLTEGLFHKSDNGSCTHDSINFYAITEEVHPLTPLYINDRGNFWEKRLGGPREVHRGGASCPVLMNMTSFPTTSVCTQYRAFLIVYKMLPATLEEDVTRGIGFNRSRVDGSCSVYETNKSRSTPTPPTSLPAPSTTSSAGPSNIPSSPEVDDSDDW